MDRINSIVHSETISEKKETRRREYPNLEKYLEKIKPRLINDSDVRLITLLSEAEMRLGLKPGTLYTLSGVLYALKEYFDLFNLLHIDVPEAQSTLFDCYVGRIKFGNVQSNCLLVTLESIYSRYILIRAIVDKLGSIPDLISELYNSIDVDTLEHDLLLFSKRLESMKVEITSDIVLRYVQDDIYTILEFIDNVLGKLGGKFDTIYNIVYACYDRRRLETFFSVVLTPRGFSDYSWRCWYTYVSKSGRLGKLQEFANILTKICNVSGNIVNSLINTKLEIEATKLVLKDFRNMLASIIQRLRQIALLPDEDELNRISIPNINVIGYITIWTGVEAIDGWKRRVIEYYEKLNRELLGIWLKIDYLYKHVLKRLRKQFNNMTVIEARMHIPEFTIVWSDYSGIETVRNVDLTLYIYDNDIYMMLRYDKDGKRESATTRISPPEELNNMYNYWQYVLAAAEFLLNLPEILPRFRPEKPSVEGLQTVDSLVEKIIRRG